MRTFMPLSLLVLVSSCGGQGGSKLNQAENQCEFAFANQVVQANGASGINYGDPQRAANGVRGAGEFEGGLDVFSLNKTQDGILILGWQNGVVCNEPGADLNVFENTFKSAAGDLTFFEAVVVSVSLDGVNFVDFPHDYLGTNSPADISNIDNWQGFAGLNPIFYHEENYNWIDHGVNPLDESMAGGNAFDLDNLLDDPYSLEIKQHGFRYVKLTAPRVLGFPGNPSSYADIDGVYAKVKPAL